MLQKTSNLSSGTVHPGGAQARPLLQRPPYIGMFAFLVVLFVQPLGHTIMILNEHLMGSEYQYHTAAAMGLVGAYLLWLGMKRQGEVAATWLGFFAAILMWTGWIEFSFVAYANHLDVAPLIEGGEVVTKPEYLVMPSSLGVMLATLAYFMFNRETRCNFFRWIHRHLKLGTGKPTRGLKRNFASITALETIYLLWFFYILLLLLYDQAILGDRHPAVFAYLIVNTVWALYLMRRLMHFSRVATAIRYAIPTAIIAWTSVEILGRWGFFTEFWVEPSRYAMEMAAVTAAIAVFTAITIFTPKPNPEGAGQAQPANAESKPSAPPSSMKPGVAPAMASSGAAPQAAMEAQTGEPKEVAPKARPERPAARGGKRTRPLRPAWQVGAAIVTLGFLGYLTSYAASLTGSVGFQELDQQQVQELQSELSGMVRRFGFDAPETVVAVRVPDSENLVKGIWLVGADGPARFVTCTHAASQDWDCRLGR